MMPAIRDERERRHNLLVQCLHKVLVGTGAALDPVAALRNLEECSFQDPSNPEIIKFCHPTLRYIT